MRGSPDGAVEPDRHRQETLDLVASNKARSHPQTGPPDSATSPVTRTSFLYICILLRELMMR